MQLIQSASTALSRLFSSSSTRHDTHALHNSPSSFPQFSKLPVELRLKIWSYAAPSRILRVHLHEYTPHWINDENRWEGYAPEPNSNQDSDTDAPANANLPRFIPTPVDLLPALPMYANEALRPQHMEITACTSSHPCGCKTYPPKSHSLLPMPGVLLACQESYAVLSKQYRRCLENEYNAWGYEVVLPFRVKEYPPSRPPVTGLIMNPLADTLHVRVNVASFSGVMVLRRFAAIVAQQVPNIQRVIFSLHITMPPYKFWASARFQYWKNWGATGWWVPAKHLIKMPDLREVVLVVRKKEKMLPVEWRNRTEGQWAEELLKVEDQWPAGWKGKIPSLTFVDNVEDA
ncbi:hypothetical protein ONS95_000691 [Cadophora gregata]|uniref:uncharacterized protein n=1 Tax=Cadophora gregata TaxID=51156 RepID=UPI0026DC8191|nr:uncharacterized protein ONS95_000691 [Cadophora gregata]KAK0103133.1 hypothetical protein ONS96_005742 [Cadophora gregata f. sp. sojae]KAK0128737.1 hypothetical protein ONS95_000691 [Cadophora gregata]